MIYHVIQAPSDLVPNSEEISIFLAGSIEMGKAKPWHDAVASQIARRTNQPIAFYNPRRTEDFTPDMEEAQIKWEQERLTSCDYIFMHIQGDTKSPISLLEFGEFIGTGKLFIDVPKDFYRYNNVVLTAEQAGYPNHVSNDLDTNIAKITDQISSDILYRNQMESQETEEDGLSSDEDSSDEVHPEDQETEDLD